MSEWALTSHALDRLLGWLDVDHIRAAKKYEQTRRGLIKYFESRGCHTPEDQADRTIDRVARRIDDGIELWVDEPAMYFYGVARHVLQEYYRRSSANWRKPLYIADDAESLHRRYDCMARCLDALPRESREMLVAYCSADKRDKEAARRALAAKLGISINTLRLRVHRLRDQLGRCVRGCAEQR
jgi:DNA-directed RNA polymerase specialized sigma24 family protein